jgi:methionyl-tRNA formyltransferase
MSSTSRAPATAVAERRPPADDVAPAASGPQPAPGIDTASAPGRPWRIVFMGTPAFAVPSLEALLASADAVVAVVTQPDRPAGRGQHPMASPVKHVALRNAVPVHQPDSLRQARVQETLVALAPDLIAVAAYGKLLPRTVLDLPAHGCINVHASLLPRHRGAAPVQWALLAGETTTGVTIMRMNEGMDEGDILLQRPEPVLPTDTGATLGERLARAGARALVDAIRDLKAGRITARPQDATQATLAPRIGKEMGRIDWRESARALERKVRALQPWPAAYTAVGGKQLKILQASLPRHPGPAAGAPAAGTVLASGADGIAVATGDGTLLLEVVQLEGRKALPAAEFLRGHPLPPETVLGS